MAKQYVVHFSTIADFASFVKIDFTNSRLDRQDGTVSYDVKVTNTGDRNLVLSLFLLLDPASGYAGFRTPPMAEPPTASGCSNWTKTSPGNSCCLPVQARPAARLPCKPPAVSGSITPRACPPEWAQPASGFQYATA